MAIDSQSKEPQSEPRGLSSHALSNARLALVACTLLATVAVLLIVTLQARDGQDALDEASSRTLRDYSGYAGRMFGADLLRRFSEQRSAILSPVTGSAARSVAEPTLTELERTANASFQALGATHDTALGYYRYDVRTGELQTHGGVKGAYAARIADTLRVISRIAGKAALPGIIALEHPGGPYSVTYAMLPNANGELVAIYGYAYTRSAIVSLISQRVFHETPLLPVSFAGDRWNYDTTRVRPGEVANDSLVVIRVSDRRGRLLWESPGAAKVLATSPSRARTVLSTNAGGMIIESAMLPAAEPLLIPTVVRKAQRWTLRGLIALSLLLVMVSLVALQSERSATQARRVEAMQQLALAIRHEINNALASVLLNAELFKEERGLTDEQRDRLEAIVEQAERMRKVVRRLEHSDRLDELVPYLDKDLMVDLSAGGARERETQEETGVASARSSSNGRG